MLLSPGTAAVGVAAPRADFAQGALNHGLGVRESLEFRISPRLKYADGQLLFPFHCRLLAVYLPSFQLLANSEVYPLLR